MVLRVKEEMGTQESVRWWGRASVPGHQPQGQGITPVALLLLLSAGISTQPELRGGLFFSQLVVLRVNIGPRAASVPSGLTLEAHPVTVLPKGQTSVSRVTQAH